MSEPKIDVLGVYKLPVTEELFREQLETLYSDEMLKADRAACEAQCREQLESAVLIEVVVHHPDKSFDVGKFSQPHADQVAYDERFLSLEGDRVVDEPKDLSRSEKLRIAFYLHYYRPDKPLHSSYGKLNCPPVQPMPKRLRKLVPYEPLD